MVRIKVISRDEKKFTRETPLDLQRVSRNIDPELHPLEKPREYTRALNAVKLQRVFAKPFVGDLVGHRDGCYCMVRHHKQLNTLVSGSCDGEIRLWNITTRKSTCTWNAHSGFTRGVTFNWEGDKLYSCGSDKTVKLWQLPENNINTYSKDGEKPMATWLGDDAFLSIDHQRKTSTFATTAANVLALWDPKRSEPLSKLSWGDDSLMMVKFNPIERFVLATTCEDRSVTLYDIRANTPIHKLVMDMRSNCLAWNPMEAFHFTIANEDHNCYTFDTRQMKMARNVHEDHVSAVLDYSPTGKEFVTGSYDRTLRIFRKDDGHSRDVYHTKRMQRIFSVQFSGDSSYVFCGSDDSNIRIWKSVSHANTELLVPRQAQKDQYQEALVEKYKDFPEIKRIKNKRHVPKPILQTQKTKGIIKRSQQRKKLNEKKHSKPGQVVFVPERKKHIITTQQ